MDWKKLTVAEVATVEAHNAGTIYRVAAREVDNPGSEHFGFFVLKASLATSPKYGDYWGEILAPFPTIAAEPDDLFLPPEA